MNKKQYISFGLFMLAFTVLAYIVPAFSEADNLIPAILLSIGCLATMLSCLLMGRLWNTDPTPGSNNSKEENFNERKNYYNEE